MAVVEALAVEEEILALSLWAGLAEAGLDAAISGVFAEGGLNRVEKSV
ncbi:hypothetical protein [Salinibacter ruber]|nr:hypothetical protein [Salinibacter ruber]MCS4051284.1 hypothetical protein [Salinibacter ruber]